VERRPEGRRLAGRGAAAGGGEDGIEAEAGGLGGTPVGVGDRAQFARQADLAEAG
jgi:hypothetical protein